ncbi:hypothetical protein WICMUC_001672 [Wickerhamomyces mucosus]|uniref:Calcineurin-like phosphoesterase domain-containing protein n=1 Tax=Wickerhamomyces mucosus TaxID=1378264 RepID=A0A9P8TH44_9ASCO|nr:hypothetical protein WICMUC_001672 [Wickerhamomyces mucosus]
MEHSEKKNMLTKRFVLILTVLALGPLLFYIFIILPLSGGKEVTTLKKFGTLQVKLVPSKTTSFDKDEQLIKNEKYYTLREWKSLHSKYYEEKERLILIGDVHGCFNQLKDLLSKVAYDSNRDIVVLLGDFISKGPASIEVLDYMIQNEMKAVFGNHELSTLSKYNQNRPLSFDDGDEYNLPAKNRPFDDESIIANKLNSTHLEYLTSIPFTLDLGLVAFNDDSNGFLNPLNGVANHMGVPNAETSIQDITIEESLDIDKNWYKDYNKVMSDSKKPQVLFYGHHASKGLKIKDFSKGLDSGCVKGGQLTSLIIWTETIQTKKKRDDLIVYKSELVQVECT